MRHAHRSSSSPIGFAFVVMGLVVGSATDNWKAVTCAVVGIVLYIASMFLGRNHGR